MGKNKIIHTDALTGLKQLSDQSINCCVTSPPYWGLRDYGVEGQLGLEKTPEEYVEKMVEIFREAKRVLRDDGTLWLNLGDTYNAYKANTWSTKYAGMSNRPIHKKGLSCTTLKNKDLIGIPWMVAFALRSDGWYLRQDIIWSKPNPIPESVTDRCTKSHEYIFLLSKSKKYYFDQKSISQKTIANDNSKRDRDNTKLNNTPGRTKMGGLKTNDYDLKNKRSVWIVTTESFSEAHFAIFPKKLIVDCIKAGCPEGGIVLDPFIGSGTTAIVARKLERNYLGFELNQEYIKIAEKRIYDELGMFQ